jgi:hypothetical protein
MIAVFKETSRNLVVEEQREGEQIIGHRGDAAWSLAMVEQTENWDQTGGEIPRG